MRAISLCWFLFEGTYRGCATVLDTRIFWTGSAQSPSKQSESVFLSHSPEWCDRDANRLAYPFRLRSSKRSGRTADWSERSCNEFLTCCPLNEDEGNKLVFWFNREITTLSTYVSCTRLDKSMEIRAVPPRHLQVSSSMTRFHIRRRLAGHLQERPLHENKLRLKSHSLKYFCHDNANIYFWSALTRKSKNGDQSPQEQEHLAYSKNNFKCKVQFLKIFRLVWNCSTGQLPGNWAITSNDTSHLIYQHSVANCLPARSCD